MEGDYIVHAKLRMQQSEVRAKVVWISFSWGVSAGFRPPHAGTKLLCSNVLVSFEIF